MIATNTKHHSPQLLYHECPSIRHRPTPPRTKALTLWERFLETNEHTPDLGPLIRALVTPGHPEAAEARTKLDGAFAAYRQHVEFVAAGGTRGRTVLCSGEGR